MEPLTQDSMTSQLRESVTAGAAWLDKVWPTWPEEVDPDLLNMSSGCTCILGQLGKAIAQDDPDEHIDFGSFLKRTDFEQLAPCHGLPPEDDELAMTTDEAVERGFSIPLLWEPAEIRRRTWRTLTDLWIEKLAVRGRVSPEPEPEGPDPDFARKYAIENPEGSS